MNRDCHGDIFERWGETWARCFADSSLFQITGPIEDCPECGRAWRGEPITVPNPIWRPDDDDRIQIMDRCREITALRSGLTAAESRARTAEARLARAEEERRGDGERVLAFIRAVKPLAAAVLIGPTLPDDYKFTLVATAGELRAIQDAYYAALSAHCACGERGTPTESP